jgi:hypothetical protein
LFKSNPFKLYVFDQECRKIFDQTYAEDPYYLPSESVFPSSIQGFSLCCKIDRVPIASFYCFPYVLKRGWKAERVLRITRPLLIPRGEEVQKEALKGLLQEIGEIGKRAGVHVIEAELYEEIKSRIFFPSTNCAVNTYNPPEWIGFFGSVGFACSERSYCFELEVDNLSQWDAGGVSVRKCNLNNDQDKKLYYNLWTLSGECPYGLTDSGFWYPNVFGWPRVWYSEIAHILSKDNYVLFAEKNGKIVGFVHWWPNLYPLLREGGWKAIFVKESLVNGILDKIEEGKIFKIIVSKKAAKYRDLVEKALINEAMRLMKEKFDFKRCQIGNISEGRENIASYIYKNGGEKVHEVWLMRKNVSGFF